MTNGCRYYSPKKSDTQNCGNCNHWLWDEARCNIENQVINTPNDRLYQTVINIPRSGVDDILVDGTCQDDNLDQLDDKTAADGNLPRLGCKGLERTLQGDKDLLEDKHEDYKRLYCPQILPSL